MFICLRLTLLALIGTCLAGPTAAYQFSPPNTGSHLTGVLQFLNGDGKKEFKCRVDFHLHVRQSPNISRVIMYRLNLASGGCPPTVRFDGTLPWPTAALDSNTAQVAAGGWSNGSETTCSGGSIFFTVDANGAWTVLPSRCLSGTLLSDPPITIVP